MAEQDNNDTINYPYMWVFRCFGIFLAVVVAIIPVLTRYEDLLPMYAAQKEMLTFFTSLICLLTLGIIFSIRRNISRLIFPLHSRAISATAMLKRRSVRYGVPLLMITISIISMNLYYSVLDKSVKTAAAEFSYSDRHRESLNTRLEKNDSPTENFYLFRQYGSIDALVTIDTSQGKTNKVKFDSEKGYEIVLALTPAIEITETYKIMLSFILIYLGSSVAFAWFGLIEYLQKENNLRDNDLLFNPYRIAKVHEFKIDAVDSPSSSQTPLYFKFSYDPKQDPPVIIEDPSGPYIENYAKHLEYYGPDANSEFHVWAHRAMTSQQGEQKEIPSYTAKLKYDEQGLQELMYKAASQELLKLSQHTTHKKH